MKHVFLREAYIMEATDCKAYCTKGNNDCGPHVELLVPRLSFEVNLLRNALFASFINFE
jgi:hypothetical protein